MSDAAEDREGSSPAIAALIRAGRVRKGWNQEDLAQRAGVSRTTLHHLERGAVQKPRATTLSRLGSVLDIDPEAWHLASAPATSPGMTPDDRPAIPTDAATQFDRETNPLVAAVAAQHPTLFQRFTASDWEALVSQVGVGGGLTPEGVLAAAQRLHDDRETLSKLRSILQTHLRDSARQLVGALYDTVAITPPTPRVPERVLRQAEECPPTGDGDSE